MTRTQTSTWSKVQAFSGAPRVLRYAEDVPFVNILGETDYMSILVATRLGLDLQEVAGSMGLPLRRQAGPVAKATGSAHRAPAQLPTSSALA